MWTSHLKFRKILLEWQFIAFYKYFMNGANEECYSIKGVFLEHLRWNSTIKK